VIAIEAAGLHKSFGKVKALDGLDLSVPRGSVCALLGPNGAGKTTAVRILATLARPDAGTARVAGHDPIGEPRRVRELIGLAGQHAAVDEDLTGRENLFILGLMHHLGRRGARTRAGELLEQFGLAEAADRLVKTWSGGMRRRLDVVASLIVTPLVLFLDEPTTGLDPNARAMMWEIVRGLAADGTTVLLTTQYLEEADQLAARIAVIDGGRVIAEGTSHELKSSVGGEHIEITLAAGQDVEAAVTALKPYATGPIQPDDSGLGLAMPVAVTEGLTTRVVRALDAAGIEVNDVTITRASLDDVFFSLTGHAATIDDSDTETDGKEGGAPA
jgi:ABC-2 type transport system ATP-binding protein